MLYYKKNLNLQSVTSQYKNLWEQENKGPK